MEQRTEIAELGEFGLIEHLTKNFEIHNASTIVSVGDDAAVIDHFGKQTVVTTDLLIEGIHFYRGERSGYGVPSCSSIRSGKTGRLHCILYCQYKS